MRSRRRRSGPWAREGDPSPLRGRRSLAFALALMELGVLAWVAAAPAFPVRHVNVSGAHRLHQPEVVAAAGLGRPVSVFLVDAATIRRRLTEMPWVRDATVTTVLPDSVQVRLSEWQPVAVYRAGPTGHPYFVSDQAVALGPAAPADSGTLLAVEGPSGPSPRPGRIALDSRLLAAMVNIRNGLPALIGVSATAMKVDCSGNLTLTTSKGFRVIFGRVLTPEEFAALKDKLSALKAVSAEVNFQAPDFEYINLENSSAPAVGPKPAAARPAPAPSASPSPAGGIQVLPCR